MSLVVHTVGQIRLEIEILVLFYYLNCALWTRGFACTTDYTVTDPNGYRFAIFHLINAHWTNVYASFASIAFLTNLDFYHIHTLTNYQKNISNKRV